MGYSYATRAGLAHDAMLAVLDAPSNGWIIGGVSFFAEETRRDHPDGALTGTVWRIGVANTCRRMGSFHCDAQGRVRSWPSTTAAQRREAERRAELRWETRPSIRPVEPRACRVLQRLWSRVASGASFAVFDDSHGWARVYSKVATLVANRQARGYWDFTGPERLYVRG